LIPAEQDIAWALLEGLPKEWFDSSHGTWSVETITSPAELSKRRSESGDLNATLMMQSAGLKTKDKRIDRLVAELEQEKRLTARLEEQNEALDEANTQQAIAIVKHFEDTDELQSKYDISLEDWIAMRDDRDKRKTIIREMRSDEVELVAARNHADTHLTKKQNLINSQAQQLEKQGASLTNANREAQNHALMIGSIVNAMEGAGYDIKGGWGNDLDLEELETAIGGIRYHIDDASSEVSVVEQKLDEIRTER
jgi:hypothetical protein